MAKLDQEIVYLERARASPSSCSKVNFMSDSCPTNLGRRRIFGEFVPGKFNSCFFKDLYPLFKLKKFIQDNTTNRLLNDRWLIFQLDEQFFISKEVSSLPSSLTR